MEEIILGSDYLVDDKLKKDAMRYVGYVRNDITRIRTGFISLGFHLDEIKRNAIYKHLGYEDFYEFCELNFHLSKSSISKYLKVFSRFSLEQEGIITGYKVKTMYLDEKYEGYTYSQLYEMADLTDKEIYELQISPGMTEKRIREIVKQGCYVAPASVVSSTKQRLGASGSFVNETKPDEASDSFVNETEPDEASGSSISETVPEEMERKKEVTNEFTLKLLDSELSCAMDKYKGQVHGRYTNIYAVWKELHITSIYPPEELYNLLIPLSERYRDTFYQMRRRITTVVYHWRDKQGNFCKYEQPAMEYTDYRTIRELAEGNKKLDKDGFMKASSSEVKYVQQEIFKKES